MIVVATQKQISVTPRKMKMLAVAVKTLKPQEAVKQLGFINYSAAKPLRKTIQQALANAVNNHKLNPNTLRIKEIIVNQGLTLKRWRAGARGRGKPYTHRRSHLTVKLEAIKTPAPSTPKTKTLTTDSGAPKTKTTPIKNLPAKKLPSKKTK